MRICRYRDAADGPAKVGLVDGDRVFDVTAAADLLPPQRWPYPPGDQFIAALDRLKPEMLRLRDSVTSVPLAAVQLTSPVANPGKFLCGAGNHKVVLEKGGHPRRLGLLFKTTSAAAGPGDGVALRWPERTVYHEAELAIVIGRAGTLIPAARALDHVAGYCIGLDMTMQGTEYPSFGKSFDSFGVMGPWLVTADELTDPGDLHFRLTVNGEVRTEDTTASFVLNAAQLVEHASSIMTLHPGDVIFSGTPPMGLGPVVPGDVMRVEMDGIGAMEVAVRAVAPGAQPVYDA